MGIVPVHHIYLRELLYGDWQIEHLCVFSFSANIGVPGKTQGCMFTPVQVEVNTYEPEKVGGKRQSFQDCKTENHHNYTCISYVNV